VWVCVRACVSKSRGCLCNQMCCTQIDLIRVHLFIFTGITRLYSWIFTVSRDSFMFRLANMVCCMY